ncbi:MAG TPA: TRAP transporter small permease [Hyphomicrobiaceae bacterium]|nr:TRAP transporter small permease [Hyphomicrobiaceae bacterium]
MAHAEAGDPTHGSGGGALGAVDRLVHWVEKLAALLSGLGIFALMLLGVVHVLGRKFFDMPVYGYIDIVEIMMAFLVFLALAYTERLGGHIRMELFVSFLKGRWLALFELVGVVLGLLLSGVLFVYSWDHAMRAYYLGDSSIDAQIPLWPSKLVVPISLAMLFVRLLVSLWAYLRVLIDPRKGFIGVPEVVDAEEQALREAASAGAFDDPSRTEQPQGSR